MVRSRVRRFWQIRWQCGMGITALCILSLVPAVYGQTDQVSSLMTRLKDPDLNIRSDAAHALGEIKDPRAAKPLIAALRDPSAIVQNSSFVALVKLGAIAVEPLIVALKDPDSRIRSDAAHALGEIGDTRAVNPLIACLQDPEVEVRRQSAHALGRIGDIRAVGPLTAALKDPDERVRVFSDAALGNLEDSGSAQPKAGGVISPKTEIIAEDKAWDAAVEPFSSAKVEAFLRRYPNGSHAVDARQIVEDEHTILRIVASGPGSRFVLPSNSVPPMISNSARMNNKQRGRTIIEEISPGVTGGHTVFGKAMFTAPESVSNMAATMNLSGPFLPCGDLSVFVIRGEAGNIQGDISDPLRLLYSKRYGVIYIGGKGKIFSLHNGAIGNVIFQTPSK